ncbi:hypothetical protein [uncultured Microscilla sp.]|uniref:hypothetical protein n=1 Tax=uncultured Microscilla sp. TaxID=432653 RepID=UPI00260BD1FA|nr:hypothetical protein [uncultured Microscilla sp.]
MKVIVRVLLTGLLLWTTVQGNAQPGNKYYQALQSFMNKMEKVQFPKPGQHYLMQMSIKMIPKTNLAVYQGKVENKEAEVKMIVGTHQLIYETNQVSIYQDREWLFQVFHPQKLILQKTTPKGVFNQHLAYAKKTTQMQKELFAQSTVTSVKDGMYKGRKIKLITTTLAAQAQKKFRVKTVTYFFDMQKQKLEKQVVKFTNAHPLAGQEIVYLQLNPNYKGYVPTTAKAAVMNSQQRLLPKFRGYSIETNH